MKRKIISLAAAAVMLFACFAAPAGGEALPAGSEQIGIPVFTEETMEKYEIPDTEGLRFTRKLKAGWNLGNTFDAKDDGVGFSGRDYETYWSGARTTRELIRAVHEAGGRDLAGILEAGLLLTVTAGVVQGGEIDVVGGDLDAVDAAQAADFLAVDNKFGTECSRFSHNDPP